MGVATQPPVIKSFFYKFFLNKKQLFTYKKNALLKSFFYKKLLTFAPVVI